MIISGANMIGRVIKELNYQDIDEIAHDMSEQMSEVYFVYLYFCSALITNKLIVDKK